MINTLRGLNAVSAVASFLGRPVVVAVLLSTLLPASAYLAAAHLVAIRELNHLEAVVERTTRVSVGTPVRSLTGFALDGSRLKVSTNHAVRGAVIFGLSGACPYCLSELDVHRRLAAAADTQGLGVYWVLSDSVDEARRGPYDRAASPGLLLVEPVHATYRLVGLGFTPQVVVLAPGGHVEDSWRGVLGAAGEARMSDAIQRVSLSQNQH